MILCSFITVKNGQKWSKIDKIVKNDQKRTFFGRTYSIYHIHCDLLCNGQESNPHAQSISRVLDFLAPCKTASSSFEWTMSNEGDFVVQGGFWNHFFRPGLWLCHLDFYFRGSYRRVEKGHYLVWKLFRQPILSPSQMYLGPPPSTGDLPRLFHWSSLHLIKGFKAKPFKWWQKVVTSMLVTDVGGEKWLYGC